MFKKSLAVLVLSVAMIGGASAAGVATTTLVASSPQWTASGVRMVQINGMLPVTVLPIHAEGFANEAKCNAYIGNQSNLTLSKTPISVATVKQTVDAICSVARAY